MNWFHYIIITLIAFVSMMGYFAVRSVNTPLDLVTEKYYEEELKFQDKIDEKANVTNLSQNVITETKEGVLNVFFPKEVANISGVMKLYYAADKSKDKEIIIKPTSENAQAIDISALHGAYTLQINWESSGTKFYTEKKIFL
ncbi:MAG: FixH family protein [Bacteroidetes bacterium]|jgi:abortive infection bacteriophage resistance protein|nr:FixH family protein [Bacteroidota bacterium]MBK8330080.1 FixH family protein [Bacteroidota bacterium]